jgi:transposase InsO family protein
MPGWQRSLARSSSSNWSGSFLFPDPAEPEPKRDWVRVDNLGIRQLRIAPRAPRQNGHAERFVGSLRRELLDRVIMLGECHLQRLVREHASYCNEDRPHVSLDGDAPVSRALDPPSQGRVVALPRVDGLHQRHVRRAV